MREPAFITVTATGAEGFTDYRLKKLRTPTRGVRLLSVDPVARPPVAALMAPVNPMAVLADLSAAQAWGLPVPYAARSGHASIAVPSDAHRPERRGVRGRRLTLPPEHLTERDGLRVTTPARTWLDCAAFLSDRDVLAMGDAVLHGNLASEADLRAMTHWAYRRRGVAKCRRVLDLLDGAAESPAESWVRYEFLTAGLSRPQCNVDVFDAFGNWLARADMLWATERIIVEYDGAVHLDERQRRRDAQRRNLLQEAGWLVIVLTADDLQRPWVFVGLVARALQSRQPR